MSYTKLNGSCYAEDSYPIGSFDYVSLSLTRDENIALVPPTLSTRIYLRLEPHTISHMQLLRSLLYVCVAGICFFSACQPPAPPSSQPNVIIVITDDQGYGDLSAHGNPWLKTPNLDRLHGESIRFTDFHVATTCSPTRSSVMTGKYCNRVGAWHTIMGRHMVWSDEVMMPELFREAGYATAMFGKWHLGDNFPYRPQDRGFDYVFAHGGGGVGQTPDHWNNDYFDDTYFRNGVPEKKEGYCTDVWFEEAISFMEQNKDKPFFCYLATNAPHGPFHVDPVYSNPYEKNEDIVNANFLGMIANIDENMGRLRQKLKDLQIADNTILVFMTDNGSAAGSQLDNQQFVSKGYNAGMRGKKGSPYEGGHRVPCFIHWKNGNLFIGRDIKQLAGAIDLAPTLLDLCGIAAPPDIEFDGTSLKPLLEGKKGWENRILFADTQREDTLKKYKQYCVMEGEWRLVNGELYHLGQDPEQRHDLSAEHSFRKQNLMAVYEAWWMRTTERKDEYTYIPLGEKSGEQVLTQHDIHPETPSQPAWHQSHIRAGKISKGYWVVKVEEAGTYQFQLRRWPKESQLKQGESAPEGDMIPKGPAFKEGEALALKTAVVQIAGQTKEKSVDTDAESTDFSLSLEPGQYRLWANYVSESGEENSAYYVYASKGSQ